MRLSVVVPTRNEESIVAGTIGELSRTLRSAGIDHEILVVNDHSTDGTAAAVAAIAPSIPNLRCIDNPSPPGFGRAVRAGLGSFDGDAVAVCMADGSDPPDDLVGFFREMVRGGRDCVFGSRFTSRSRIAGYPRFKRVLNRAANASLRWLFHLECDDVTNAFKLYRRHVVLGVGPLKGRHFELAVELPLKAVLRGYSYAVVPNSWIRRGSGRSKFRIARMAPRYLLAIADCLVEKWMGRGRRRLPENRPLPPRP